MGHLSIVSRSTEAEILTSGMVRIRAGIGPDAVVRAPTTNQLSQLLKTIADVFSDPVATRRDDPVFPWCVTESGIPGTGFRLALRVSGRPLFAPRESYPVIVPTDGPAKIYSSPLPEIEALDLWQRRLLWNAIGKKSLGRGRALTHQMPSEDVELQKRLDAKGNFSTLQLRLSLPPSSLPLTIRWAGLDTTDEHLGELLALPKAERLGRVDLDALPWVRGTQFRVEKALEAWLVQEVDQPSGESLRNALFENVDTQPEWVGNYLPFGVAGSNIDVVVLWSSIEGPQCTAIELKKGAINEGECEAAINQVSAYCDFLKGAVAAYEDERTVEGVVLCASGPQDSANGMLCRRREVGLIVYTAGGGGNVDFTRIA